MRQHVKIGKMKYQGRYKPYTDIGISRVPCARCGLPSSQQWSVCANGGRFLGICQHCDIELNRRVMAYMRLKDQKELMQQYINSFATTCQDR